MSHFARRALAVTTVTAAVSLAPIALMPSACTSATSAPPPPLQTVITIPGPDQLSSSLDPSRCSWLMDCMAALAGGISNAQGAEGPSAAPGATSEHALRLASPLTADEHATAGS